MQPRGEATHRIQALFRLSMRLVVLAGLTACGPRQVANEDGLPDAPSEDLLTDPEDTPEGIPPPAGAAPRLRRPLPDGWPREPVEPLPLKGSARTLLDHADPVARFVVDLAAPGTFELGLKAEKSTAFKARVVVYDSLGATLDEVTLTDAWQMEPRDLLPGTIYLLVERRGGTAELVVTARFSGEIQPEE